MKNPLISIIVPVYNTKKYLEKCIDSLCKQTYKNIEIMLIDDGSTDGSDAVCDTLAKTDERIKVIHKKNNGLLLARKSGTELCNGNYVINVDSDDWLDVNVIEELFNVIVKYEPDVIIFGYYNNYLDIEDKKSICLSDGLYNYKRIEKEIYPKLIMDSNGSYVIPSLCFKAIKKEIALNSFECFNSNILVGEDFCVSSICLLNSKSIYVLDCPLYHYRFNNESIMRSGKTIKFDNVLKIKEVLFNYFVENDLFTKQCNRRLFYELYNTIRSYFYSNNYYEIKRIINRELKNEVYISIINNAEFSALRYKIKKLLIKKRMFIIIYFEAKLRSIYYKEFKHLYKIIRK